MTTLQQKLIDRHLQDAYTVGQLIEELQQLDPESLVLFGCDYGDIGHTEQALPVTTVGELHGEFLVESGYSHSHVAIQEATEEDEDRDEDDWVDVVVLR